MEQLSEEELRELQETEESDESDGFSMFGHLTEEGLSLEFEGGEDINPQDLMLLLTALFGGKLNEVFLEALQSWCEMNDLEFVDYISVFHSIQNMSKNDYCVHPTRVFNTGANH